MDENPYRSPNAIVQSGATQRRWWQLDDPPYALAILFSLGILQYWGCGLLLSDRVLRDLPLGVALGMYYLHWSSVGGLIGLAVSRRGWRGSLIGAAIGLILSQVLML